MIDLLIDEYINTLFKGTWIESAALLKKKLKKKGLGKRSKVWSAFKGKTKARGDFAQCSTDILKQSSFIIIILYNTYYYSPFPFPLTLLKRKTTFFFFLFLISYLYKSYICSTGMSEFVSVCLCFIFFLFSFLIFKKNVYSHLKKKKRHTECFSRDPLSTLSWMVWESETIQEYERYIAESPFTRLWFVSNPEIWTFNSNGGPDSTQKSWWYL